MSSTIKLFLSGWEKSFNTAEGARDALAKLNDEPAIIDLVTALPAVTEPKKKGDCPRFVDATWNALQVFEKGVPYFGIRLALDQLQEQRAAITWGLSWEQTVEDFAAELYFFPELLALSEFPHLFLCCGSDGLVHIENVKATGEASTRRKGRLYFSNKGKVDTSVPAIIELLKQLRKLRAADKLNQVPSLPGTVSVEIPEFVLARPMPNESRPPRRWHILNQSLEDAPVHRINVAVAIVRADLDKVLNRQWKEPREKDDEYDLWQTLTRVEFWNPHDRAPDFVTLPQQSRPAMPAQSRRSLPVIKGNYDHQGFCLAVPIRKIEDLFVAEREQIENLCDIRRLFEAYIDEKRDDTKEDKFRHPKPLSVAVFGPPGAGKSFAVQEIAKSIAKRLGEKPKFFEFNVAQFHKPEDLTNAFGKLSTTDRASKLPPVVFFDEFDSALGSDKLGWLRYFLAPMQDGKYYDGKDFKELPRSIFVFAGGVHISFENFDPRSALPSPDLAHAVSEEYRKEIERFEIAKGPDFISRLRGYINIPNPNAEPGRSKHFLRRAIQLRGLLTGKLGIGNDAKGRIKVAEEVIYALLTIDRYRHGVRSMEAILRMCQVKDGWIKVPSLPSRTQLNMHVDSDEFFIRLHRGRARMEGRPDTKLGRKLAELLEKANACRDDLIDNNKINELLAELGELLPASA